MINVRCFIKSFCSEMRPLLYIIAGLLVLSVLTLIVYISVKILSAFSLFICTCIFFTLFTIICTYLNYMDIGYPSLFTTIIVTAMIGFIDILYTCESIKSTQYPDVIPLSIFVIILNAIIGPLLLSYLRCKTPNLIKEVLKHDRL